MIIGLMSGTSLDGLDIALCKVSGDGLATSLKVERFMSVRYSAEFLAIVRPLFANPSAPLDEVTRANAWVAREHARMLIGVLNNWGIDSDHVDILASHGQTIFHAPRTLPLSQHRNNSIEPALASATLQIGDGDHLAFLTKILTLSDFRQKHIAANGEGAPLVPYADYLLFSSTSENRILVNIGGIANFTYIPSSASFNQVVSADSGPGNTLMDALIQNVSTLTANKSVVNQLPNIDKLYDSNGDFALKGKVDVLLLNVLLGQLNNNALNEEQSISVNKSTGQETFNINFVHRALETLYRENTGNINTSALIDYLSTSKQAFYNLLATLNLFTAKTIGNAIANLSISKREYENTVIYLSGGGVHNPVLVANIRECAAHLSVKSCNDLGIDADAKEAALFAVLANQTLFGNSSVFANDNGIPQTAFGKISLP